VIACNKFSTDPVERLERNPRNLHGWSSGGKCHSIHHRRHAV